MSCHNGGFPIPKSGPSSGREEDVPLGGRAELFAILGGHGALRRGTRLRGATSGREGEGDVGGGCFSFFGRYDSPSMSTVTRCWVNRSMKRDEARRPVEHRTPLLEGEIGGDDGGGLLVTTADDLEEQV